MRLIRTAVNVIVVVLSLGLAACGDRKEGPAAQPAAEQVAPADVQPPAYQEGEPAAATPPASPAPAAVEPTAPPDAGAEPAAAPQPATIEFELYKAGFIVGVSGGRGTLHFQGKAHPLSIGGVSVGATAGISKAELVGEVHNLERLEDIEGTYSALQAGLTLGGGAKVTQLENSRKVRLQVRGKQIGIELSLDLNGMQISLVE
jgi:predicted small lipoprotein YifL